MQEKLMGSILCDILYKVCIFLCVVTHFYPLFRLGPILAALASSIFMVILDLYLSISSISIPLACFTLVIIYYLHYVTNNIVVVLQIHI